MLTREMDDESQRDFGITTCAALASLAIDPREESRRQLIALRLNVRSGYLSPACPVQGGRSVEEAAREAFRARRDGRFAEARDIALGINEARSLTARMPCAKPLEGQDLLWEPPPPAPVAEEAPAPVPKPAPSAPRKPRR